MDGNPSRLLCLWNFPGKNTGAGCHFLLQGIYLTQESSLHLLCLQHCRWTLPLSFLSLPPSSSTKPSFEGLKLHGLVYLPPPYGQKGELHGPLLGTYNLNLRWKLATPSTPSSYLPACTKKAISWQRKSSQISKYLNKIPSVGTDVFTGGKRDSTLDRSFNLPQPVSSVQNGDKTDLTGVLWEFNEILYLKP